MPEPSCPAPAVSVVVPLYQSARTLRRCLVALGRQTWRDFETILVDSSPDDACARLAAEADGSLPGLRYHRSPRRLLPQAARETGVGMARAPLLVFTDPDCYPHPGWLARLVAAHRTSGGPVVGALACHGTRWLDSGVHLCKFSKWLPAPNASWRIVDMGPTAALLCPRDLFERAGGFGTDGMMGDIHLSWCLRRDGAALWLAGDAVTEHDHQASWGAFLAERYRRGRLYGRLRLDWMGAGRGAALGLLAASALPLRLASNLAHTARHAARAGRAGAFAATLPVVAAGHAAALAGESAAYARHLLGRPRRAHQAATSAGAPR